VVIAAAPELEVLDLSRNELDTLEVGPLPALHTLEVGRNQLAAVPLARTPALRVLRCHGNYVHELDLSGLAALEQVDARANQLTELRAADLPRLQELVLSDNHLGALEVERCPSLQVLRCSGNQLRALSLAGCPGLLALDCADNPLRSLRPEEAPGLIELRAERTELPHLDLTQNPVLLRLGLGRSTAVTATEGQRLRLRELRERASLGTGSVDPDGMSAWELHDLAASLRAGRGEEERLLAVVRAPACDRGTAAMVYWSSAPHVYAAFQERAEVPSYARVGWELLRTIEERLERGEYRTAEIHYDPTDDRFGEVRGVDRTAQWRRATSRPIPPALLTGGAAGAEPGEGSAWRPEGAERRSRS
jgi:hypothetical protein